MSKLIYFGDFPEGVSIYGGIHGRENPIKAATFVEKNKELKNTDRYKDSTISGAAVSECRIEVTTTCIKEEKEHANTKIFQEVPTSHTRVPECEKSIGVATAISEDEQQPNNIDTYEDTCTSHIGVLECVNPTELATTVVKENQESINTDTREGLSTSINTEPTPNVTVSSSTLSHVSTVASLRTQPENMLYLLFTLTSTTLFNYLLSTIKRANHSENPMQSFFHLSKDYFVTQNVLLLSIKINDENPRLLEFTFASVVERWRADDLVEDYSNRCMYGNIKRYEDHRSMVIRNVPIIASLVGDADGKQDFLGRFNGWVKLKQKHVQALLMMNLMDDGREYRIRDVMCYENRVGQAVQAHRNVWVVLFSDHRSATHFLGKGKFNFFGYQDGILEYWVSKYGKKVGWLGSHLRALRMVDVKGFKTVDQLGVKFEEKVRNIKEGVGKKVEEKVKVEEEVVVVEKVEVEKKVEVEAGDRVEVKMEKKVKERVEEKLKGKGKHPFRKTFKEGGKQIEEEVEEEVRYRDRRAGGRPRMNMGKKGGGKPGVKTEKKA